MSMFWLRTTASSALYAIEFSAALRRMEIIGMKNCGRMTYIFSNRYDTSTMPWLYSSLSGSSKVTSTAYSHPFFVRSASSFLKKSSFLWR